MQRLSGKYTFGTASSRRVFYTRVRYAFLMLELCITIIIYHNAATLWQVHLRHCVLKESLLYTVRYAFLMLELCITIIIYHNAATLWQVHLRHCVLKESLLYTVRYAFLMLELCITIIIYHNASSRRVCQQNPIQCLFLWHCCYAAASTMLSTKNHKAAG